MAKIYAIKLCYDGSSKIVHRFLYEENRDLKFGEIVAREKELAQQGKIIKLTIEENSISGRDVPTGYCPDDPDWTFSKVEYELED